MMLLVKSSSSRFIDFVCVLAGFHGFDFDFGNDRHKERYMFD